MTPGGGPAGVSWGVDLDQFVAVRGPAMLRLAWLLTGDGPAAEDLVQEALARVLPRWSSITPGAVETYVRTAIHSVWVDTLRRRSARVPLDVVPEVPEAPASPGLDVDARLAMTAALATLTPRQRTVLVLRFYEDLTEVATARTLGISVNTVKSVTRQALSRLRAGSPGLQSLLEEAR